MIIDWNKTKLSCDIDPGIQGRQIGDLKLPFSDNKTPLGYYPIPIISLANGVGPTLFLCGGTHGDEYEGPAAILDLVHSLDLNLLQGRIIALPASNGPAFADSARCSPLDGGNLNRLYPGDANGSPTQIIAHFVESLLLPHCDAAIDFHAGGKASIYSVLTMINRSKDGLYQKNKQLAEAFGADFIWEFKPTKSGGSVNDAAERQGVPMFASELFGGGRISRESFRRTREGLYRVLKTLGMLGTDVAVAQSDILASRIEEIEGGSIFAKRSGVFVPHFDLNDKVKKEDLIGTLYSVLEPERTPQQIVSPVDGILVSLVHRGAVERGERLLLIAGLIE